MRTPQHAAAPPDPRDPTKERLGTFIHHPVVSLVIAALIVLSVSLVLVKLLVLPTGHWAHEWIEWADVVITALFVLELGTKYYVAESKARFFGQYWIDMIAIIPWAHSLRVLRILRLLRVFRVAIILSRRVRFVSSLFRSAIGEYVVLGMIMFALLAVGTFAIYLSERQAREARLAAGGEPAAAAGDPSLDLAEPENAVWATVFFLVATEPMIAVPQTSIGKAAALVVMFGGLTTFAVFTGVVTALMVNRLKRRMEIDDMDRYHLNNHMVICGWNNQVPLIIEELFSAPGQTPAVVVVAELEDPPEAINRMDGTARVFFVRGDYTKPDVLKQARVTFAARAIVVADSTRERSDQDRDARTVLAALMIEQMRPDIYTCAELLNRENEHHLRAAGVEEVITTSEAGGHHMAMAAMHAGLAQVVDELITVKEGHNLQKVAVPRDYVGLDFFTVLRRFKEEKNAVVLGLEVRGQDGPRTEGYAMQINPSGDAVIGERDNLILVSHSATPPTAG